MPHEATEILSSGELGWGLTGNFAPKTSVVLSLVLPLPNPSTNRACLVSDAITDSPSPCAPPTGSANDEDPAENYRLFDGIDDEGVAADKVMTLEVGGLILEGRGGTGRQTTNRKSANVSLGAGCGS